MSSVILSSLKSTSNVTTLEKLSLTASKIALDNFEWQYVTLVFFNSTLLCCIDGFIRAYRKSTVVGKGASASEFAEITRQFVVFGTNIADITDTLMWMENQIFDNSGKYIIICQSHECEEKDAVQLFWYYKITNVIFLRSFRDEIFGYTYFPLNDSHCTSNKPMKLNLKSCMSNADSHNCSNIFSVKLKNFNRCSVIASTFIQTPYMKIVNGTPSGADGNLIRLIADGLNASLILMTPRQGSGWGALGESGSWSGSLADVYYGYANFSMTSAAITSARYSNFHVSTGYSSVSVAWVTHPPNLMPSSFKLIKPFQAIPRAVIATCFVLIIICSLIFRSNLWISHCRGIEECTARGSIMFYSWMMFMGLPLPSKKMPKKTAFLSIILLWIWFGVLMRTFYQVSLMTVLKANYYYSPFETIYGAIEEEYHFGGGSALKFYYEDDPPVYDHWVDVAVEDIIPTLRSLAHGKKFVIAMNMETARSVAWQEKMHLRILEEKVIVSPTVISFKKYSPLVKPVNTILVRLTESGFSSKFYKDYVLKVINKNVDTLEPINLDHYTGCYAVLIAGWVLSFILCFVEMIYDNLKLSARTECNFI